MRALTPRLAAFGLALLALTGCPEGEGTGAVTVTLSDSAVTVQVGESHRFSATVSGGNSDVRWSITEGAAGGSISGTGLYVAPLSGGSFTVVATSVADASKTASATVTVVEPLSISVLPATTALNPGQQQSFTALVRGAANGAVTWSVREAGGGTVSAAGLYTAPATLGTYTVEAKSAADGSKVGTALVTVTNASLVRVQVSPNTEQAYYGQQRTFTATVSRSNNTAVTWSLVPPTGSGTLTPSGNTAIYTAPTGTPGTFQVVATSVADPSRSASATVEVSPPPPPTVSGTVFYPGTKKGRVYLRIKNEDGPGTSLDAPGPFTIRGVRGTGPVTLEVFLDALGTGHYVYAGDPRGERTVNRTGSNLVDMDVTLIDPPTLGAPPKPTAPTAFANADSILVSVDEPVRDLSNREVATSYRLYWSTSPNPGPANRADGAPRELPASANGLLTYFRAPIVEAGASYYFAVAAVNDGLEGPTSDPVGPIAVAAPMGGTTMTGEVQLSTLAATGPIYVGFHSNANGAFFAEPQGAGAFRTFVVTNVPAGKYRLFAFLDADGDGRVGPTDPKVGFSERGEEVSVGATPMTGFVAKLPTSDAHATVRTHHFRTGVISSYSVDMAVEGDLKRPASVVLVSGAGASSSLDLGLERGFHSLSWPLESAPTVGQRFTFDITYADGTSGSITAEVQGALAAATLTAPLGPIPNTTPTFTWTLPGGLPAKYQQRLRVRTSTGTPTWNYELPTLGQTSVAYNFDGNATPLASGNSYLWTLGITDQLGNTATTEGAFSVSPP